MITSRISRRPAQAIRAAALAAVAALALVACTDAAGSDKDSEEGGGAGGDDPRPTRITVTPGSAATAVATEDKVTVRASDGGELTSVKVTATGPGRLDGKLSGDKDTWSSSEPLAPGVTYTVVAEATGEDAEPVSEKTTFTTEDPAEEDTFVGEYNVDKGSTVGVALPVSIVFNKPIDDKAAVERGLSVTADPGVEGAWNWMKDRDGRDRIDYRPEEYWKPGTEVTLRINLDGVDAGDGLYGTQTRKIDFTVGDAVVSTVDVVKKTMAVEKNGKLLRTLPISAGKKGFETWNGTMVVLSKVPSIRMNSETVGIFGPEAYDLKDVKWDVQLTPSGTYAHAAPWNDGKFGQVNGSHGCIGMSTSDAKWFYDQVHFGDPVTVVKSTDTVPVNNGYGAWNVDWDKWQAGSALR